MVDKSQVTWDYFEAALASDAAARVTWDYLEAALSPSYVARVAWDYIEIASVGVDDDIAYAEAEAVAPYVTGFALDPITPGDVIDALPTPPCNAWVIARGDVSGVGGDRLYEIDISSGGPVATLRFTQPYGNRYQHYGFSRDGRLLVFAFGAGIPPANGAFYGLLRLEDFALFGIRDDLSAAGPTSWSPTDRWLAMDATIGGVRATYVWEDLDWLNPVASLLAADILEFSPDSSMLAIGQAYQIKVYRTSDWSLVTTLTTPATESFTSLSWHPSSSHLATIWAELALGSYGQYGSVGHLTVYETAGWTAIGGMPNVAGATGGGFQGFSAAYTVEFSPAGNEFAVAQSRGNFNSAFTYRYSWPAATLLSSDGRAEGDAQGAYISYGFDGQELARAQGSLNFPGHIFRGIGTGGGSLPGNRAELIKFGPWTDCIDKWGSVRF